MISELFADYQFGAIYTPAITDGKVTNRASIPPNERYSAVYVCVTCVQATDTYICMFQECGSHFHLSDAS